MAVSGVASNPTRFGAGQTADERSLFLEVFGGEVLTAFDLATIFGDKVTTKTVGKGQKAWRFPKTWKTTAEYHTAGQELMGNDFDTGEVVVTIDDILVAHKGIYDLDEMLSHFDVRQPIATAMGQALAKFYDKNIARSIAQAARTAGTGPFPGGTRSVDSGLAADGVTGKYDGIAWIDAIRDANLKLHDLDVPEEVTRNMAVNARVFDAIKFAKDSSGNYMILDRDFRHNGAGGIDQRAETIVVDGVTIYKTRNMPTADETAATDVYAKYRADYSGLEGLLWIPDAVATVKMSDIGFENTRDTRRLEDFMVAKMLCGHGTLRPEGAVEFNSVA